MVLLGGSGSGKSTLLREVINPAVIDGYLENYLKEGLQ